MNTATMLRHQAVQAAKQGLWAHAISLNTQILKETPKDTHALNRLGVAHLQLSQKDEAIALFTKILEIDKTNTIAKRHLERIKDNQHYTAMSFSNQNFIEEPGKTKVAELHRLASKQALNQFSVGQTCELTIKKRFISVTSQGTYLGALPEDLSFRLSKLIESGNEYSCSIRSCSGTQCWVYLKETVRSAANKDTHSFPPVKSSISPINDIDESFALEDAVSAHMNDADAEDDEDKSTEDDSRSNLDD
jgi:tetratricopeptide (TPR) repeat protein